MRMVGEQKLPWSSCFEEDITATITPSMRSFSLTTIWAEDQRKLQHSSSHILERTISSLWLHSLLEQVHTSYSMRVKILFDFAGNTDSENVVSSTKLLFRSFFALSDGSVFVPQTYLASLYWLSRSSGRRFYHRSLRCRKCPLNAMEHLRAAG